MTLPLVVRPMLPDERPMVLSNWKMRLFDSTDAWRTKLTGREFWDLVNHVIDDITLPSCEIFVGVHESDPLTPLCWAALRDGFVVFTYVRRRVFRDAALMAAMYSELIRQLPFENKCYKNVLKTFDPYKELRRT